MRRIAIIVVGLAALASAACGSVTSNGDASARGGSSGSTGTGGGGGSCQTDTDCQGFRCCGGRCVNANNDILNCGACGHVCTGTQPYCANGTCATNWPCIMTGTCSSGTVCCGAECCNPGQLCCTVTQGPSVTACFEPVNGTCPTGCAACVCTAPTTPIATPTGDRPIAQLRVGDLIYSVDRGSLAIVPIKLVHRQPVTGPHRVVELQLAHGAILRISPRHPTADGRQFGDLAAGDFLDRVRVTSVRLVDYAEPFTYDILPTSDSGTYFAGGALIGSTLAVPPRDTPMSVPRSSSLRRASVGVGNN